MVQKSVKIQQTLIPSVVKSNVEVIEIKIPAKSDDNLNFSGQNVKIRLKFWFLPDFSG